MNVYTFIDSLFYIIATVTSITANPSTLSYLDQVSPNSLLSLVLEIHTFFFFQICIALGKSWKLSFHGLCLCYGLRGWSLG